MDHKKKFHQECIHTPKGEIFVEGPVPEEALKKMTFHQTLQAFREPEDQYEAVVDISTLPESRIIIVRDQQEIVGYATFLYPDPLERWSDENMEDLLELGAIEIAFPYRGYGLSKKILEVAMKDEYMENYIVITTEYYWHWDLKNSGLDVWQYRKVMEKVMAAGGLSWYATDDPEITSHPANCLMAKVGKNVPRESIEKFDRLRFKNRFMY
ncbi:MAG TPA: N-acetyltransferase [Eubacteriaceae bacterium]|nr:N-acetyltransferase [Eubacteriaceae bacterium]